MIQHNLAATDPFAEQKRNQAAEPAGTTEPQAPEFQVAQPEKRLGSRGPYKKKVARETDGGTSFSYINLRLTEDQAAALKAATVDHIKRTREPVTVTGFVHQAILAVIEKGLPE